MPALAAGAASDLAVLSRASRPQPRPPMHWRRPCALIWSIWRWRWQRRRGRQAAVGIGGVETKKWEIPLFPLPHHSEKELKSGISHSFPGKYRTLRPRAPRTGPHVPPLGSRGGYLGPLGPWAPYVLCFLFSALARRVQRPGPPTHREIKNTPPMRTPSTPLMHPLTLKAPLDTPLDTQCAS